MFDEWSIEKYQKLLLKKTETEVLLAGFICIQNTFAESIKHWFTGIK